MEDCFESSAVFDACVGILVRELRHNPIKYFLLYEPTRHKVMDEMITQIVELFMKENIKL